MNTNKKHLMIWIVVGLLSLLVVGVASAQPGGGPRGRDWNPPGGVMLDLVTIITQSSGLNLMELRQELQAGKSLATIIAESGGNVAAVKSEALATLTEAVNQAVINGRLRQAQADNLLSTLEARVDALLNNPGGLGRGGRFEGFDGFFGRGDFFGGRGGWMPDGRGGRADGPIGRADRLLQAVATSVNLTVQEVRAQHMGGATLSSILESAGVNLNSFVDEHLAAHKARLDEQVAVGRISQAVADARLALARAELLDRLNR